MHAYCSTIQKALHVCINFVATVRAYFCVYHHVVCCCCVLLVVTYRITLDWCQRLSLVNDTGKIAAVRNNRLFQRTLKMRVYPLVLHLFCPAVYFMNECHVYVE